ncbi:MAG: hypothetical protein EXR99_06185 [Gemmataceae bacterium]|nr:hypothetical protein [Gemmataceae bacterium]
MALKAETLERFCQSLGRTLGAGIAAPKAMRLEGKKGSRLGVAANAIADALEGGDSFTVAFSRHKELFPSLMLAMIEAGEESGNMAEVLRELGKHFGVLARLSRQLKAKILLPLMQLGFAILTVTILILVMGFLPVNQQGGSYDPLGWGLSGPGGAVLFLALTAGTLAGLFFLWKTALANSKLRASLLQLCNWIPFLSDYLRESALGHFSIGLAMTLDSAISIKKALRLSLDATANEYFKSSCEKAQTAVKRGSTLTQALADCQVFPEEFLAQIEVAEESGSIPEVCQRLAAHHNEEASRHLAFLFNAAGVAVWLGVAFFIVKIIFNLYGGYINALGA